MGIYPITDVLFDLVYRPAGIYDRGRRYLAGGHHQGGVEIDPPFGTWCERAALDATGMAGPQDVGRAGQAQEVRRVEIVEHIRVPEDLFGQHNREVDDDDIVLGDLVSEPHHRPPEGSVVLVRRDDADEILCVDIGVEKDRTGYCPRQPGAQCGLADAGSARNDQQRRADEGALVAAMRAPQHEADRRDQVAPTAAGLTCERHAPIMAPSRGWPAE
jgi:hypothetical protein